MHDIPEVIDEVAENPSAYMEIFLRNPKRTGMTHGLMKFYVGHAKNYANAAGFKFVTKDNDTAEGLYAHIIVIETLDNLVFTFWKTVPCLPTKPGDQFLANAMQVGEMLQCTSLLNDSFIYCHSLPVE